MLGAAGWRIVFFPGGLTFLDVFNPENPLFLLLSKLPSRTVDCATYGASGPAWACGDLFLSSNSVVKASLLMVTSNLTESVVRCAVAGAVASGPGELRRELLAVGRGRSTRSDLPAMTKTKLPVQKFLLMTTWRHTGSAAGRMGSENPVILIRAEEWIE